jgi:type IV fimbrial biogenesis protein FimT
MSLIELAIGLVILGILIAAGAPSFMAWIQNTQIRTTAESLQNGLQVARNEAVRRNARVEFILGGGTTWTVMTVGAAPESVQSRSGSEGSVNVILTETPGGATTVTFNGFGRVDANADGSAPLTRIDLDVPTSVIPAADSRDLSITIGGGGQIRMCDPNVSATGDPRKC